ncbi:MAG: tetratricopeptide (TPR) repeat protein [Candidatus Binatia bacterium]|jgi:tetratricopeptide (TPR) repeat protein
MIQKLRLLGAALALSTLVLGASGFLSDARASSADVEATMMATEADRYLRAAERHPKADSPEQLRLYVKAEGLAEKAIALDENCATGHFIYFAARGRRLISEGGLAATLKMASLNRHLDRALELDPNYAHALAAKGGILLDLPFYLGGDAHEAERYLAHAVRLNPTGPGTRVTYAKALLRNGQETHARENLLRAAHYACVTRRAQVLAQATTLLDDLDQ